MAGYATIQELKNAIHDSIYENHAGLVTADILQERLIEMIDTLEASVGVTGTGTIGYLPRFTGASIIGDSIAYNDGTNISIHGTMLIGSPTPVANNGAGSMSPLEIVGTDGGLAISSTDTGEAGTVESYVAGFLKDDADNCRKVGTEAFQWADKNITDGYGSWHTRSTAFTGGVAEDYYGLATWAKHGAAFFPTDASAASAPGLNILKVNGALIVTETLLVGSPTPVANNGAGSMSPLEIVGTDGGLAISSTDTGEAGTVESYVAGFLKDDADNCRKVGTEAFQWADKNITDGYGSWHTRSTAFTGGVAGDYYGLATWAKHGAAFFPADASAASAPGLNILKVNGALNVQGTGYFTDALTINNNAPLIKYQVGGVEHWKTLGDATKYAIFNTDLDVFNLWINNSNGYAGFGYDNPDYRVKINGTLYAADVFTSAVATGTAPFAITSTTLNYNLNADLLDGQHGSYYEISGTSVTHAALTTTAHGLGESAFHADSYFQVALTNPVTGTGNSGHVAFWNGTSTLSGNGYFMWDNANKNLTISAAATNGIVNVVQILNPDLHLGSGASLFLGGYLGGVSSSKITSTSYAGFDYRTQLQLQTQTKAGSWNAGIYINEYGKTCLGGVNPVEMLDVVGNIKTSGTTGGTATPDYIWLGNNYSNGTENTKLKIYLYHSGSDQYGFTLGPIGDIQYHSGVYHDFYISNILTTRMNNAGIITPSIYLTTGAAVGKAWLCTNATTGAGQWAVFTSTQMFISTWDANNNVPELEDGVGTAGYYHNVTIAGTQTFGGISINFVVGDAVIYNGSVWQLIPKPIIVGTALTKTDDTNITLTLEGSPTSALLNAASITAGWTGTLADDRIASATNWNTAYGWGNHTGLYLPISGGTLTNTVSTKLTLSGGTTQNGLLINAISGGGNSFYLFTGSGGLGYGFGIYDNTNSAMRFYIANNGATTINSTLYTNGVISTVATGTSTEWNAKQAALISGTSLKTVGGVNLLGSGDIGIIGSAYGGTANGFIKFTGATTSEKTYTLPNANETFPAHGIVNNVMLSNGTIWTSAALGTGAYATIANYLPLTGGTLINTVSTKLTLSGGTTQNGLLIDAISGGGNSFYLFTGSGGLGYGFGIYDNTNSAMRFYIANNGATTITGTTIMPVLKVTTGAGLNKVLLSDADGLLSYSASALGASAYHADNYFQAAITTGTSGNVMTSNGTVWTSAAIPTRTVPQGGTGLTTLTDESVIIGNGTGTPTFIAPGNQGNVFASYGGVWGSLSLNGAGIEPALGNPGTTGYVLSSTTAGVRSWVAPGAGGGITSLGGLTGATQTFGIGTTGTAPNWSSATTVHTLRIPMAATANVTAGLISKTEYDVFNAKQPAMGADDNYVTDAQKIVIGNTSGTNTGNQSLAGLVPYTGCNANVNLTTYTVTAGNFILYSDRRLKTNIELISDLSKFDNIKFYQFNMKNDLGQLRYGSMADEVELIAPELVYDAQDSMKTKSVAYTDMLIGIVARQAELIKSLENRVKDLEEVN